jgi:hypothetical protein
MRSNNNSRQQQNQRTNRRDTTEHDRPPTLRNPVLIVLASPMAGQGARCLTMDRAGVSSMAGPPAVFRSGLRASELPRRRALSGFTSR